MPGVQVPRNCSSKTHVFGDTKYSRISDPIPGDDEPWEMFIRMENWEIHKKEYQPFERPEEDAAALETGCYAWRREGLPKVLKIGWLYEEDVGEPD